MTQNELCRNAQRYHKLAGLVAFGECCLSIAGRRDGDYIQLDDKAEMDQAIDAASDAIAEEGHKFAASIRAALK